MYLFSKHFCTFGPKIFGETPLIQSTESKVRGFKSQHKTFSYILYQNIHQSTVFQRKIRAQFHPMSTLSHTGGAKSGQSWLL